jgi:hypothetical protein
MNYTTQETIDKMIIKDSEEEAIAYVKGFTSVLPQQEFLIVKIKPI